MTTRPTRRLHVLLPLILVALRIFSASSEEAECTSDGSAAAPYSGVDVSYPIHAGHTISDNPLGDKNAWYENLINGCKESCERCDVQCVQNERDRIAMNRRQPQSMVNYTDLGIQKTRVSQVVEVADHWCSLFGRWPCMNESQN
jgi:hypothetical protein